MDIKITNKAAKKISALLDNAPEGAIGIRLSIATTGCSGNSYQMEYADELSDKDDVVENNEVSIYIPKIYSWMLIGTTIDFITDELGNERFDFINPNEVGRCGCGESFQIERGDKT